MGYFRNTFQGLHISCLYELHLFKGTIFVLNDLAMTEIAFTILKWKEG